MSHLPVLAVIGDGQSEFPRLNDSLHQHLSFAEMGALTELRDKTVVRKQDSLKRFRTNILSDSSSLAKCVSM